MNRLIRFFLGLFLATVALAALAAPPAGDVKSTRAMVSSYRVGPGDIITIRVVGEDDLSREKIRLTDAGTLFFPSLGEIDVHGLTVGELETLVTNRLKGRILVNPQVLVQIDEYRPFFTSGMVGNPGSHPYQPGLNVGKAVALSGGFKERASMSGIYIVREGKPSDAQEKATVDTPVFPGDMIIVRESFF